MTMNTKQIYEDVEQFLIKNKDFYDDINRLLDIGKKCRSSDVGEDFFELVNELCKKSKRIMLKSDDGTELKINDRSYNSKYFVNVGINSKGLGVMSSYSSQLNCLGDRYHSSIEDRQTALDIIKDKKVFEKLLKAVNKNSVEALKEIKKFFKDKNILPDKNLGRPTITFTDEETKSRIDIDLDNILKIREITITSLSDGKVYHTFPHDTKMLLTETRYMDMELREVSEGDYIFRKSNLKQITISLSDLPYLELIFRNKHRIKKETDKIIKFYEERLAFVKIEKKFIDDKLIPIRAFKNL